MGRAGLGRLQLMVGLAAIGNRAYSIALVVLLFRQTGSPGWVAGAAVARYGGGLVAGLVWAQYGADRKPQLVLVASNALCALSLIGLAIASYEIAPPVVLVVAGAAVRVAACTQPSAVAALLPQLADGHDLADLATRQNLIEKLALLAGPGLGGLLLLAMSGAQELVLLALCCMLAAGFAASVGSVTEVRRQPALRRAAETASTLQLGGAGWTFAILSALSGCIYGTDTVFLLFIGRDRLGLGDEGYGLLFAAVGAGALLASRWVNQLASRDDLAVLAGAGLMAYCLPTAGIAVVHTAVAALALEVVRGAGLLVVEMLAVTGLQRVVQPRDIPRAVARSSAMVLAGIAIGALASPLLLHAFGLRTALLGCGLVVPALVVAAAMWLRRIDLAVRRRAAELGPRVAVLQAVDILAARSRPLLERLASGLCQLATPAGTIVIRQGDPADAFYVLVSGTAVATVSDPSGRAHEVGQLLPGECFGEIGLLEGTPRLASVQTREASVVYRISAADFHDALSQLPPSAHLLDVAAVRRHSTVGVEPFG
jgi:hypothetical protein